MMSTLKYPNPKAVPSLGDPAASDAFETDLGGVRVVFGAGVLERLGETVRSLGRRALVVTDPGLVAAGYAERVRTLLEGAGVAPTIFDGVEENPTTDHVAAGVVVAREYGADVLVGLGGGSSLDTAKGINFLLTQGGAMEDYWGDGKTTVPMLPSVGVPTTAGTGSEAQRFALVSRAGDHVKMACGDRAARFRTVLLDPDFLTSVPREVAAVAGIDALSHAVESYVTTRRNPLTRLYAGEAWRLLDGSFEAFLESPDAAAPRAAMLWGAHLAGAAIETAMLGAAHSCANPLTARYGIVHGAAVGIMLPHVVRRNGDVVDHLYTELADAADLPGTDLPGTDPTGAVSGAERVARRIEEYLAVAGLAPRLRDWRVDDDALPVLAEEAASQWTARFNPHPVDADALRKIYEQAH